MSPSLRPFVEHLVSLRSHCFKSSATHPFWPLAAGRRNGQLFLRHHDAPALDPFHHGRLAPWQGRHQARLPSGSSLPLSHLLCFCHNRRLHLPPREISHLLPHSHSVPQESLLGFSCERVIHFYPPLRVSDGPTLNVRRNFLDLKFRGFSSVWQLPSGGLCLKSLVLDLRDISRVSKEHNFDLVKNLTLNHRAFCGVPNDDSDFDVMEDSNFGGKGCNGGDEDNDDESRHNDEDNDDDDNDGCEHACVESGADPNEVGRVCKVIEELFALDRNMEAVLDECQVNLSHDLVVDVLERFRHARKPAFRFFNWAGQKSGYSHDSRTYNKMMSILGSTRQFETMMSVLEEMGEKGLLTMETFTIAIKAFASAKERKKAVGIFELMKKYKFRIGVDTINCLLDSLGKAKLGKEAQVLFEKIKERFTPNLQTYSVLLNGWCRIKNLMETGKIWNEMIDRGFKPDIIAHNTMLEGLLRCQRRSDAIKLFEVMKAKGPCPNVRSYTILIRDFCKQTKMKDAVEYFDEMLDNGCKPDAAMYTCLLTGFGNLKRMDQVYGLLKEMKDKGCPPDGKTYNALIKLMTNRRMPDDAVRIYKKMVQSGIQPTIHTYNMMMKSYFQTRNYEMGCAVWEEMGRKGCCPDDNSYIVLIGGLIRQGRSDEACKYLEEMIEKGMKAPQLDYNKFAADFSRAGNPYILEELAQKMKFHGKFEVSNFFTRWAEMMKKRVNRREPARPARHFA